jgi:hypothetical protein
MKKTILASTLLTICSLAIVSTITSTTASSTLPNDSTAGAPADNGGQTCASCHGGSAVTVTTGVISSNIPGSGFIGGTTYSVSVTMSGASAYGFELTPQTATSNVGLGTWIAGTGSSVSGKYIKQTVKKTGATAVWTFSWTAPTTATAVTFYGAFNYANNNSTSSGDVIKKSSVSFLANTTSISESDNSVLFSVFPNPTTDVLHITSENVFNKGSIYSLDGKLVKTISEQELASKAITVSMLTNGTYFLHMMSNDKPLVTKFSKND